VHGGPMYYLKTGLAERGYVKLGQVLSVFFAICTIGGSIGGGNLFQANQSYHMMLTVTGGESSPLAGYGWVFGLVIAVLVGWVIIGGIKGIARVTSRLVPAMAVIYATAALVIVGMNFDQVPAAFVTIFNGAFNPQGVAGGIFGVLIMGFQRAAFSNEAGLGSAAIAHSAVKTEQPATEGFVALLEPFIDTVVICTLTALVIIISGVYQTQAGIGGVEMTSAAFGETFGWFKYVLALAVLLFAISTMLSWAYYGSKACAYLFGKNDTVELVYKFLFCVVIVIGCTMNLGSVVNFSDAMIFSMGIANLIGLYFLAPMIKEDLNKYLALIRGSESAAPARADGDA